MYIYYYKIKLFTFFYIWLISLIKCDTEFCRLFDNDCYKCVLCEDENLSCDCFWNINGCTYLNRGYSTYDSWASKITICQNSDKSTYANYAFCPLSESKKTDSNLDSDNSITFTLKQDSQGYYGKKMTVCNYEYEQYTQEDIELQIEFSSSISIKPKIYIESTDYLNSKKTENIYSNTNLDLSKVEKVSIKILFKDDYRSAPVTITLKVNSSNIARIISITLVVLFFAIVIGCIIFCSYRMYKNNEARKAARLYIYRQAQANMARIAQENNYYYGPEFQENSVDLEQMNKEKLDRLFRTKMVEHLYKKEYNEFGGGCSICLAEFKKKSKVSITSCKHVFHYKCIHDWLYKNIRNPKCPNCNNEILNDDEDVKIKKEKATNIIKVKKKDNINTNINMPNLNVRGINIVNNNFENGSNFDASNSNRPELDEF